MSIRGFLAVLVSLFILKQAHIFDKHQKGDEPLTAAEEKFEAKKYAIQNVNLDSVKVALGYATWSDKAFPVVLRGRATNMGKKDLSNVVLYYEYSVENGPVHSGVHSIGKLVAGGVVDVEYNLGSEPSDKSMVRYSGFVKLDKASF